MFIDVTYRDKIPVVTIAGDLDMYDSSKMEAVFNSLEQDSDVIIDCTDISFVDSTVIGLFVRFSLSRGKSSKKVALINVKPFFIQLLELAKLTRLFLVYNNVEEYFANTKK